ncbi:MAG: polymer-forming cytoskeletal protein, partial [Phycisphaerales bacterium]|nr:polymer-forming cytoskeletal protein [Phycisphaerales bacterium]
MPETSPTYLAADAHFKGEIVSSGVVRIAGELEGRIAAQAEVLVETGGVCKATIEAATVTVEGAVEGEIRGRSRVTLAETARVHADITAGAISIAEGATFVGNLRIGRDATAPHTAPHT